MNTMKKSLSGGFMVLLSLCALLFPVGETSGIRDSNVLSFWDGNGIRVVFNDIELFFNASNGGEITEYYDLCLDPLRQRNLVDLTVWHYQNLLPLFASIFYFFPENLAFSTGGDPNATLRQIAETDQYVIIQTSSRMMSTSGLIAKDVNGSPIYINSTWIISNKNLVFVERTLYLRSYASVPLLWQLYPFYFTRVQGFDFNGTFYMFNTTYTKTFIINEDNYPWNYLLLPKFVNDTNGVYGVALPFSNTSVEGDGTHNIVIVYKYDELVNVNEWRSDNFNLKDITETGAVHRFVKSFNVSTHTYHAMVNFTHQPINEENVQSSAKYFVANLEQAHLMKTHVLTDKNIYHHGDSYTVYGSGVSYYNLTEITARLTIEDDSGEAISTKHYGPGNLTEGQTFNITLLSGTVSPSSKPGNYTITFQIFSSVGILIASYSKMVQLS